MCRHSSRLALPSIRAGSPPWVGALRLESFFIGQVVGSFQRIRPAAEITRQIVADCEQRIADLARTLPGAAS